MRVFDTLVENWRNLEFFLIWYFALFMNSFLVFVYYHLCHFNRVLFLFHSRSRITHFVYLSDWWNYRPYNRRLCGPFLRCMIFKDLLTVTMVVGCRSIESFNVSVVECDLLKYDCVQANTEYTSYFILFIHWPIEYLTNSFR